jgi:nicotinamide-nucleotide amidase
VNSCIISLPGVPREMEYLTQAVVIPYLRERFQLTGTIKAKVLHVAGVGESTIDDLIGDLETESNPTVGLLAHPGQVDIRITAMAENMTQANLMIAEMEKKVRERVKEGLYGADQETLEETVLFMLRDQGWSAVLVECGLNGALRERMANVNFPAENIFVLDKSLSPEELLQQVEYAREARGAEAGLGISLKPEVDKSVLNVTICSPRGNEETARSHGGERALSYPWSVNTGLELFRRHFLNP